jgi:hypothetical protein
VSELAGDEVRRSTGSENPGVYRAAAARITLEEIFFGNAHPDADRMGFEVPARRCQIAKRGSHEDVGPAAAGRQTASDVLAIATI